MLVGRVGRSHGLHGYVIVHPDTDNPDRFRTGSRMTTQSGEELIVERAQDRPGTLLVRFETVHDRSGAESLAGTSLYVDAAERRPLAQDEFWPDDLVGLAARSVSGADLGVVDSVIEGAAQYRLSIRGKAGSFEVPFVADLVPEVDIDTGIVVIADLPGLVPGS